jgi:hypothetical protein
VRALFFFQFVKIKLFLSKQAIMSGGAGGASKLMLFVMGLILFALLVTVVVLAAVYIPAFKQMQTTQNQLFNRINRLSVSSNNGSSSGSGTLDANSLVSTDSDGKLETIISKTNPEFTSVTFVPNSNAALGEYYQTVIDLEWEGPWASPFPGQLRLTRVGSTVTMSSPNAIETAITPSIIFTSTLLPEEFRPPNDFIALFPVTVMNDGQQEIGILKVTGGGGVTFNLVGDADFAGTNAAGFHDLAVSWNVDFSTAITRKK